MAYSWKHCDLVLLGIGASVAVGAGAGLVTGLDPFLSVAVTSLVSLGMIGHGLFVNGPVDEPADPSREFHRRRDVSQPLSSASPNTLT
jgi:hypothetical protein